MTLQQATMVSAIQAARICGEVAAKMAERGREDDAARTARDAWHCACMAMEYLDKTTEVLTWRAS